VHSFSLRSFATLNHQFCSEVQHQADRDNLSPSGFNQSVRSAQPSDIQKVSTLLAAARGCGF
jgi:hypothetical protein